MSAYPAALYRDHMRRAWDYLGDKPLCRRVIARHAAKRGSQFIQLGATR